MKIVAIILMVIGMAFGITLPTAVGAIHAWEKANGYPYGKMCHSIFTLGVDTCKKR